MAWFRSLRRAIPRPGRRCQGRTQLRRKNRRVGVMLLAPKVFNAVIDGLESDARRGLRSARRDPRVLLSTRLSILPCPQGLEHGLGAPLSVPVRDLSRGGLRFLLPRRLPLDTQFVAILPGAGHLAHISAATEPGPSESPLPVNPVEWLQPEGPSPEPKTANPEDEAVNPDLPPLMVLCGVAYWQPLAKDVFAIGGQFLRVIHGITMPDVEPRIVLPGDSDADPGSVQAPVRRAS
jgi:hypothetical protein